MLRIYGACICSVYFIYVENILTIYGLRICQVYWPIYRQYTCNIRRSDGYHIWAPYIASILQPNTAKNLLQEENFISLLGSFHSVTHNGLVLKYHFSTRSPFLGSWHPPNFDSSGAAPLNFFFFFGVCGNKSPGVYTSTLQLTHIPGMWLALITKYSFGQGPAIILHPLTFIKD